MAIVFNGAVLDWYQEAVYMNGTAVSTPESVGDVYFNGARVFGLSSPAFSSETALYDFGLAPDSGTFENTHIPTLLNTYGDAFEANVFQSGLPGSDTRWYIKLYAGYRMVTSDGTFIGGDGNETVSYDGVNYTCYLWEGRTVTGANTSHNGGTSVSLRRDDGI